MYKQTILFVTLVFFTIAGYAADQNIEALQAQLNDAHKQIEVLKKENKELKNRLASKEEEIAGYRAKLEKLEAEIAALKEGQ